MATTSSEEFSEVIERATSESIPNGELNLPVALEISDILRSRRIAPKDGMRCLKKRVTNTTNNPNTQLSSWKLVEICIKNGGIPFLREICSREFMDTMEHTILKYDDSDEVVELVTTMLYELYLAFQNDSQLNYVSRVYDKLRQRGVKFPEGAPISSNVNALFDSKTPADWIDSDACMICSKKFSLLNRRHHCRSCGGVFCQDHSSKSIPLPDLGIYDSVRVCDNCYDDYDYKKGSGSQGKKRKHRKSHRHATEDEDEDLRKAIELSLRASNSSVEPVIPVVESEPQIPAVEEEDPDLKAAIEASLREAEEEKRRREEHAQQQNTNAYPQQFRPPANELTPADEEDIYLFASLVERMKTRPPSEILDDPQLQQLAQKVFASKPRLGNTLNSKIQKYNTLVDMNGKISHIMNTYDNLLEQELRNINLSERFNVPQAQADPYSQYSQYNQPAIQNNTSQTNNVVNNKPLSQRESEPQYTAPTDSQTIESKAYERQLENLVQPPSNVNNEPVASEPPYPNEELNDITSIQLNSERAGKYEENAVPPGSIPYPIENDDQDETTRTKKNDNITNFDFPTVPARKLPENNVEQVEDKPQDSQEEALLIEL
ncbi:VHS domain profile [Nakaseomyces glabratus]|nr:VHS domain profile [Nakaseomyces glabratus]KAH7599446.1 VHS domain profile [Nakaseomyces glabratus]KAH7612859.1 VHS domain profile [Nakaseomyces glabratus]